MASWSVLTSYARVLLCIARDPGVRLRDIAAGPGSTERSARGIVTGLTYKLDRHWGLYGWAGYDRLIEDAADSPIVRAFGSRDQFSAGFAIIYEFDIADPF